MSHGKGTGLQIANPVQNISLVAHFLDRPSAPSALGHLSQHPLDAAVFPVGSRYPALPEHN
jgi:hypothetical protein